LPQDSAAIACGSHCTRYGSVIPFNLLSRAGEQLFRRNIGTFPGSQGAAAKDELL
jgi:hypothetical protein